MPTPADPPPHPGAPAPDAEAPSVETPDAEALAEISRRFIDAIPWANALGMQLARIGAGEAVMRAPYDARFIGDPTTGVIHGGVITALLDSCCGAAVLNHPRGPRSTATIDLRIDYMRPARVGRTITAHATCHRATRSVAFVRAVAYDDAVDDPVATATAAFTVQGGPTGGRRGGA